MKFSIYLGEDEIAAALGENRKRLTDVSGRRGSAAENRIFHPKSGGISHRFQTVLYIKDCCRIKCREGTLINDVVADEEAIRDGLNRLKSRYRFYRKRVHLIMGGNQVITRVLEIPCMSGRQILRTVAQELKDLILASETEDYAYDYCVLRKQKGTRTILCIAVKHKVLEEYSKLFQACGMRLCSVEAAVEGQIGLAGRLVECQDKTFLIAVAEGRSLRTSLYVHGVYTYTNQMRMVGERGSELCVEEMAKTLQAVIHFYKVRQESAGPDFVSVCGLSDQEVTSLRERLESYGELIRTGFHTSGLLQRDPPPEYQPRDFVYVTGSLLKGGSSRNLLVASRREKRKKSGNVTKYLSAIGIPALFATLLTAKSVAMRMDVSRMEKRMGEILVCLKDQEEAGIVDTYGQIDRMLAKLRAERLAMETIRTTALESPEMTGGIYRYLKESGGNRVSVSEPVFENGTVQVLGQSADYHKIADYVDRLDETGIFETIHYGGFAFRDGMYEFRITCVLRAEKGDEE